MIEDIFNDYEKSTGKPIPEEIDMIAILRQGLGYASYIEERLKQKKSEVKTRVIGMIKSSAFFRTQIPNSNHIRMYKDMLRDNIIPSNITQEEFFTNSRYRLINLKKFGNRFCLNPESLAIPKPENLALLLDDCIWVGWTIHYAIKDLEKLGYPRERIYFCVTDKDQRGIWHSGTYNGPWIGNRGERLLSTTLF